MLSRLVCSDQLAKFSAAAATAPPDGSQLSVQWDPPNGSPLRLGHWSRRDVTGTPGPSRPVIERLDDNNERCFALPVDDPAIDLGRGQVVPS